VRSKLLAAAALGAALLLFGCGGSGSNEPAVDLSEARSFAAYPLYYLGSSFHGLPLTFSGLGGGSGTGSRRAWSFIYGDCAPSGDAGCAPPLEVQNWSICSRFPAIYSGRTPRTSPMRGAATLPAGGGLDVYTGHTTVVIFGRSKTEAIRALTRVSDDIAPPKLPAPALGSLGGQLPCQARRMARFSN
jgi:hypothetical protein